MLRFIIFLGIIIGLFPIIYKIMKKYFKKYDEEITSKTMEDYVNDVDISKQKLKEQIEFEENYIKQKNQSLKKVKGKIK
jgi:hypothetical protein